jgi:hypothetical protein
MTPKAVLDSEDDPVKVLLLEVEVLFAKSGGVLDLEDTE